MSDYTEEGAQILRENYRGVVRSVRFEDGAFIVDAPAGAQIPEEHRGYPVRRIDSKPTGATRPATSTTPAGEDPRARLARLRAENDHLRNQPPPITPDEQRELDELEAENARLRGGGH